MRLLGDKVAAKDLARKAKVPVVPGSEGEIKDEAEAIKLANKIGYPVILKAAAGGGGRGMRVAHNYISLHKAFSQAKAEA
jgi:acetyl-CoA carboxylase biotin carboxylase subunit